jgi:hypothetical protein
MIRIGMTNGALLLEDISLPSPLEKAELLRLLAGPPAKNVMSRRRDVQGTHPERAKLRHVVLQDIGRGGVRAHLDRLAEQVRWVALRS